MNHFRKGRRTEACLESALMCNTLECMKAPQDAFGVEEQVFSEKRIQTLSFYDIEERNCGSN